MNQPAPQAANSALFSSRNTARIGLQTLFCLIFGFGGWATLARIPAAIIAPAQFEVSGNRNAVQHSEGGLLVKVLVSEGEKVSFGQPIAILSAPGVLSEYAAINARVDEIMTRRARLEAERDGARDLVVSDQLSQKADQDLSVRHLIADQTRLLDSRREVRQSQSEQLARRLIQISAQIEGIDSQVFAKREELEILSDELGRTRALLAKGLIDKSRVDSLRREHSQMAGSIGELSANRAQSNERAIEIELEINRLGAVEREAAAEQLAALIPMEIEIEQALIAARSKVDRLTLRAPANGTILGLRHSRPGSVLQPAETLAWLVPSDRPMILAARISPANAAELSIGQAVSLRLPQNGLSQDQPLKGRLQAISADAFRDPETGVGFFRAEIALEPHDIDRLRQDGLMPGMTAEAFFVTDERSPLVWLLDPFTRFLARAMRES